MVSWLVGAVLAAWFLVTILRNLPPLRVAFARRDAARLLPDWALFARPRTADVILLRRDLLRDGTLTSWREVEVAALAAGTTSSGIPSSAHGEGSSAWAPSCPRTHAARGGQRMAHGGRARLLP